MTFSQPRCAQNTMSQALHSSPLRSAYCMHTHIGLYYTVSRSQTADFRVRVWLRETTYISLYPRPRPIFWWGLETRLVYKYMHDQICIHDIAMSPRKMTFVPNQKDRSGTKIICCASAITSYKIRARPCKSSDVISLKYTDIRGVF